MSDIHKDLITYMDKNEELPFYSSSKNASNSFFNHCCYRFNIIYRELQKLIRKDSIIMDFGSYPGSFIDFLFKTTGQKSKIAGLGFDEGFKNYFKDWEMYDFDFEEGPNTNVPIQRINLGLCFNIIEHMEYPNKLLDSINFYMEKGGHLVLTTDNITTLNSAVRILKGNSPFEPLIQSKIFFNGPWKPHIRFYSFPELKFLLNYSGFKVERNTFFDVRASEYNSNGSKRKKTRLLKLIKEQTIYRLWPHLQDHHLIVAKKVVDFEELNDLRPLPTSDSKDWVKIRKNYQKFKIFTLTQ